MANEEHVERLKHGVKEWNQWRRQQPCVFPDLSSANLSSVDLSYANLNSVNLSYANLTRAILTRAKLIGANLTGARLGIANLTKADLTKANLHEADLRETTLTGGVVFEETVFNRVRFGMTTLAWVDLNCIEGLETAVHSGPSAVDINSVIFPLDEHTRLQFLRGVGFSETAIEYLPSILTPTAIQYYSLFLSYAHQDEVLAHRLYQDLQDNGVRCWMAPHDLRPGDYHHHRIDEAIHLHEKTLLLLSSHAANSSWVKHEVQVALAREIAQDCTVLFPLRLDEAVMHTSKDWAVRLRESRHIGDFTNWQEDTAYQEAFSRLLRDLKVSQLPMG